jgi:hypothetical protein
MSTSVQQIGNDTYAVNTGESAYMFNDKNGNGTLDKGDLVVRTQQSDQSVFTYEVGREEGSYAWGDPHLDNVTFKDGGQDRVAKSLNKLFEDVKDGELDAQGLLTQADQALKKDMKRNQFMDFQADMTLQMIDGTKVQFGVESDGKWEKSRVAFTDAVDITVTDADGTKRVVTINEVWGDNGGKGEMSLSETTDDEGAQAVASNDAAPLFWELSGANVQHRTKLFGEEAGTAKNAKVVEFDGTVHLKHGVQTGNTIDFYGAAMADDTVRMLDYSINLTMSEEDDTEPTERVR